MKTYDYDDVVDDEAFEGESIDYDVLKKIIADASRYHHLKTAQFGALYWNNGYIDPCDAKDWDEIIDPWIED